MDDITLHTRSRYGSTERDREREGGGEVSSQLSLHEVLVGVAWGLIKLSQRVLCV